MISTPRLLAVVAVLVALGAAAVLVKSRFRDAGDDPTEAPPAHVGPKHVLILSIDTLRADALPMYGHATVNAPALAALAADSTVFERAMAPSPWTRPSFVSLLSGLPPAVHGVSDRNMQVEAVIPASFPTLPERLQTLGYTTAAFGYNPFLATSPNVRRGFERFDFFPREKPRESDPWMPIAKITRNLTELCLAWLDENAKREFFLWLHYYDPHGPYLPEKRFFERVADYLPEADAEAFSKKAHELVEVFERYLVLERETAFDRGTDAMRKELAEVKGRLHPMLPTLRDLYLAEVEQVDEAVGRIVQRLKDEGTYDDTLIIVTSDHGEEFGEHGGLEHGHCLFREVLHVPLMVKLPGQRASHRVRTPVSLLSVLPTIVELCSGEQLNPKVFDPSLAATCATGAEPEPPEYLIAEQTLYGEPQVAVVTSTTKYIHYGWRQRESVYRIDVDPAEKNDLIESKAGKEIAERSREFLERSRAWSTHLRERLWDGKIALTKPDASRTNLLRRHGYIK